MQILVLNCGSSSLRADVVDTQATAPVADLEVTRLAGDGEAIVEMSARDEPREVDLVGHEQALEWALPKLLDALADEVDIDGVGHRVVHGGETFTRPTRIDDEVEEKIEELTDLAPLHNPANLAGIRAARRQLDGVPHVAVFDTGFHSTLPTRAQTYAIDDEVADEHGIRRFGFHGISHEYVASQAADYLEADLRDLRLVTCHLGNGCSAAAIEYGSSMETSMGMTPLEGLAMGTRSGDVDPGALIYLLRQEGWDVDRLDELLNRESGLAGVSGVSNDLRDIKEAAADGDEAARQAIQVFSHRVRKYIGAYAAVMGGVDAIVLTAGIGENSALMRHRIGQRLDYLGLRLDEDKNREVEVDRQSPVADISTPNSRCKLLVAATDEQRAIAEKTSKIVAELDRPAETGETASIPIAISARHCHLTQETVEKLFGEGYELTPRNDLSQPGQFAAEETVRVIGSDGEFEKVRILGPTRDHNQVEISRTDEFKLGIDAPVRMSGDIENTPGVTLEGPEGRVQLSKGLICARRHIHMTPEDADRFGVDHRDMVKVAVDTPERDVIFGDTVIRVSPDYRLEMHIDTDEGNAANLSQDATGALVETEVMGNVERRDVSYDDAAE